VLSRIALSNPTVTTPIPNALLSSPTGIAMAPGGLTLYVADQAAARIDLESVGSGIIQTVPAALSSPTGVAVDSAGNLYVADQNNGIERVPPAGTAYNLGSGDSNIVEPYGIAVDSAGNVYYTDTALGIVGKIAPSTTVTLFAQSLSQPEGVAVAPNGDIFVAETNNGNGVIHR
jgi:streptogramin lyase